MPKSLIEQAKQAADRKIKSAEAAKAQAKRDRAANLRERKALIRIKIKQRDLIGETIRVADLTPQEHVVIAKILARRAAPLPNDWDVLADWLHPAAKAKPEIARDPLMDVAAE
jgi:hypothetical protein